VRNHTLRTFGNLTQRMAQVMGRKSQVSVSFGGTMASAALLKDGRYHINLPALPAGTIMSEHQYRVYNGYIDHEAAHLRWSDFRVLKKGSKNPILRHMVNLVEDIRIENKQIETYPGSRKFLDALCYHVDKELPESNIPPKDQAEQILGLIYKEAYAKYRSIDTNVVNDWLGDYPELKKIEEYMTDQMPKLSTTKDTTRIAKGIIDRLPKNVDWPEPPPKLMLGDGGGGIPQLIMISAEGRKELKEKLKEALKALEEAASDNDKHEDRKQVLVQLIEKIDDDNMKAMGKCDLPEQGPVLPPCGTHNDRVFVPSHEDMYSYQNARNRCGAEITAAKKMLSVYLRSRKNKSWSRGLEEGELDTSQLHNLVSLGSNKVMKERRSRDFMNTAVLLLIDNSGSMNAGVTKAAAIILAEALNGIKWLKLDIAGFTTNDDKYKKLKDSGRINGLDILLYKDFDEPYVKARGRLGAIECTGYTPLGEAYGHGLERLIRRKEERRVLWILSDGEPQMDLADNSHSEYELMRRNHAKCRRYGIETIGTYVGWKGRIKLKSYVDRFSGIDSISQMPQAMLEIIKGITK